MSMKTLCRVCGAGHEDCKCVDCIFCVKRSAWDEEEQSWNYGFRTGSQPESPICYQRVCNDCQRDHLEMSAGVWEDEPVLRSGHKLPWFSDALEPPQDFAVLAILSVLGKRSSRKSIHHHIPSKVEGDCHAFHPNLYLLSRGYDDAMVYLIEEKFIKTTRRGHRYMLSLTARGKAFPYGTFQFT